MKANKIRSILVMLVVSVTAIVFTSCSSDDDGDGSKDINVQEVAGTWTCTASTDSKDGKTTTGYMVGKSITINEDGSFSSTASTIGNGTWTLKGNQIIAKNTSGDTFTATLSVSGSTMKWTGTTSYGYSFDYTWKKNDGESSKDINVQEVAGTWTCTASTDSKDGKTTTGYMVGKSITINEDGSFSSTASTIGNGTWVLKGNQITAKNTSGNTFSATLSVSGSTMKWNGTTNYGYSFDYTWKKN